MRPSSPAKLSLRIVFSILAVLGLVYFLDRLETTQLEKPAPRAEIIRSEEPLVMSALRHYYPDETFEHSLSEGFAKSANISPGVNNDDESNWSVEYRADYRAIFINLGARGDNSIDIHDRHAMKKENAIANDPTSTKQCISIWLVSPFGRYDMVWHNPDIILDNKKLREGFAIRLNPNPET